MNEPSEHTEKSRKGGWSLVRQDNDAANWYYFSGNGFYLRHPALLRRSILPSEFRAEGPETADRWRIFERYGRELWVVDHDLTECINSMKTDYESLYGHKTLHGRFLGLKRFSIVYHIDNFYVRVHCCPN
jgi:hypothetical protein